MASNQNYWNSYFGWLEKNALASELLSQEVVSAVPW